MRATFTPISAASVSSSWPRAITCCAADPPPNTLTYPNCSPCSTPPPCCRRCWCPSRLLPGSSCTTRATPISCCTKSTRGMLRRRAPPPIPSPVPPPLFLSAAPRSSSLKVTTCTLRARPATATWAAVPPRSCPQTNNPSRSPAPASPGSQPSVHDTTIPGEILLPDPGQFRRGPHAKPRPATHHGVTLAAHPHPGRTPLHPAHTAE